MTTVAAKNWMGKTLSRSVWQSFGQAFNLRGRLLAVDMPDIWGFFFNELNM